MRLIRITNNLINLFVSAVMAVLGVRFVLRLFGANESATFVSWVYETSAVLLAPFRGIFTPQTFENNLVLELTTIFAMIVYAVVGLLLASAVTALSPAAEKPSNKSKK